MKYCKCEICGKMTWMTKKYDDGYVLPYKCGWFENTLGDFCPGCLKNFLKRHKQLIDKLKEEWREKNE